MGDIQIQRGFLDASNGNTENVTSVTSLSSAFVLMNNNRMQSAGPSTSTTTQNANGIGGAVELTSTDTITHRRITGTSRHYWELWEYVGLAGGPNEFIVRARETVVFNGVTSINVAISGVTDRNQCVAFVTGITSTITSNGAYSTTATAYLTSNTNLRVEAQPGSGTTTVYITVVEFTGTAWSISYGELTSGNDGGSINMVTDSTGTGGSPANITFTNAFIYGLCRAGDTTNVALADHWPRFQIGGSPSTVNFSYDGQHDGTHSLFAVAIENPGISVSRYNSNISHQGAQPINIASAGLTNINRAASFITRQSSGTGTAYARNWVSSEITSTTNVNMWAHRTGNTLESEIQIVDLANLATIGITSVDGDNQILVSQTNIDIVGFGFGATQGTGRVEFWDDIAGTTRVTQTINSWSDNLINIDLVDGGFADQTTRYFVVINDLVEQSASSTVFFGLPPLVSYSTLINDLIPDHRWRLNNDNYADTGTFADNRPITFVISGDGGSFELDPICEGVTHSWLCDGNAGREPQDSNAINLNNEARRTMGGWIKANSIFQPLCAIYKEGGNVNNICFLIGMGNILVAQLADTGDDNVQVYSDFSLEPGRPYHIIFRFDYTGAKNFEMFIDGKRQSSSFGNPLTATDLDSHSGDITFGYLDTAVEVFGTDVTFRPVVSMNYNEWATWRSALTDVEIQNDLFRRGAIPTEIISSGTPVAMQTALDSLSDTFIPNSPLGMRVESPNGGIIDLSLTADNVVFDEKCSEYLEWQGGGTLTWINTNGSNLTADKVFSTRGGNVTIINPAVLTLTGLQNPSEVRIYDAGTTNEIAGSENVTTGTFSTSVQVSAVDIVVFALNYIPIRLTNIDTSGGDITLPIQQRFDRYYNNP